MPVKAFVPVFITNEEYSSMCYHFNLYLKPGTAWTWSEGIDP